MEKNFLSPTVKSSFAKAMHDLAAPLGALNLCIDEIKKALPDSADIIEASITTLSHRIQFWRMLMTGLDDESPKFADAYKLMDAIGKSKNIILAPLAMVEDYPSAYVRLILAIFNVMFESLPRGGFINIDAEIGKLSAKGPKCFVPKEFAEAFAIAIPDASSRNIFAVLIKEWANQCGFELTYTATSETLDFSITNKH